MQLVSAACRTHGSCKTKIHSNINFNLCMSRIINSCHIFLRPRNINICTCTIYTNSARNTEVDLGHDLSHVLDGGQWQIPVPSFIIMYAYMQYACILASSFSSYILVFNSRNVTDNISLYFKYKFVSVKEPSSIVGCKQAVASCAIPPHTKKLRMKPC